MEKIDNVSKNIHLLFGLNPEIQSKIIATVCIVIIFFLTWRVALKLLKNYITDVKKFYFWRRTTSYTIFILVLFFVGQLWLAESFSMGTFLGLVSGALTIVYKEILMNLAGGIYIISRGPFHVGDRIEINGIKGDVIDIRLTSFLLVEVGNYAGSEQTTGRVIHIPTGQVLTHPLANYTIGFEYIWDEIPVMITFESNWKKAKKLFYEICKRHTAEYVTDAETQFKKAAEEYAIMYKNLAPTVYTAVVDSGVLITLRFLIKPRRKREIEEVIWEDILHALAINHDVILAYRTSRVYRDNEERKHHIPPPKVETKQQPTNQ